MIDPSLCLISQKAAAVHLQSIVPADSRNENRDQQTLHQMNLWLHPDHEKINYNLINFLDRICIFLEMRLMNFVITTRNISKISFTLQSMSRDMSIADNKKYI